MEKVIKLYNYVNGVNDTPFPNKEEQVEIFAFDYNANRMGGAPSITAKVKHRLCLDNLWTDKVYGVFNGEKYFIVNTPSSSKSNTDERYEHEVQLLSEREVLNHVYFIDAVQGNETIDRPKSNTTKVQFMGDIKEFVGRLNSSLQYRKVGYNAVIDEGITSENKLISFEDKYIAEALQEAFTQYNIPYYFNGKTIHFGYTDNVITAPLKYGSSDALLGISKTNANYQIINRITGVGSADNIPYYYPNESEKGKLKAIAGLGNKSLRTEDITITKMERFAKIDMNEPISYSLSNAAYVSSQIDYGKGFVDNNEQDFLFDKPTDGFFRFKSKVLVNVTKEGVINVYSALTLGIHESKIVPTIYVEEVRVDNETVSYTTKEDVFAIVLKSVAKGQHEVYISYKIPELIHKKNDAIYTASVSGDNSWHYKNGYVLLDEIGISITKIPQEGDSFHQERVGWITPSPNLMPTIYRNTLGAERFYNAKNNTYKNEEGTFYDFENEWSVNKQLEGKVDFPDIKPSIVGMTNASGQRIDQFIEFAYDEKDDESYDEEKNEYVHSYFFAKMRKTDGKYGFNLFDQANEKQTMQVSMLEGVCGACTFEIGVGENTQKNIVQVDAQGNLLRDKEGNVIRSGKPQPQQNDTRNNEVWIALKKDENTYPTFKPMPNATHNLRPKASDKFVLLGITMPQAYIDAAEKRLEDSLIKYMWMNNREKFNISIKFSRIYFAEHPDVLSQLNENSRVLVEYNGDSYTLYIDDYSYKMDGGSPLPEIEVNLVDTLTIGKNSLQTALDSVKQDILSSMGGGGGDFLKQGLKYFLRKDISDTAKGLIRFLGGAEFGRYMSQISGGKIDSEGIAELESILSRSMVKSPIFQSPNFVNGIFGEGFQLKYEQGNGGSDNPMPDNKELALLTADGKPILTYDGKYIKVVNDNRTDNPQTNKTSRSYLEVDELFVRVKAYFTELEVKKLSHAGGNWIFSPAGVECSNVTYSMETDRYKCYFVSKDKDREVDNEFKVDDQVMCKEFNIKEGTTQNAQNRYYWMRCVAVGNDWIELSAKTKDKDFRSNATPMKGDTLVTLGNWADTTRQNAIIISAYGEGSPSITQHQGIGKEHFSLDNTEKIRVSPNGNKFTGEFVIQSSNKNIEEVIGGLGSSVEAAKKAAEGAEKAATESKESANAAKQEIANMVSDSVLTPYEKIKLKNEYERIKSEYITNRETNNKYKVPSYEDYTKEYNSLVNFVEDNGIFSNMSEDSYISPSAVNNAFDSYYDSRNKFLSDVSIKAKEIADNAEKNAQDAAQSAQDAAEAAAQSAQDAAEASKTMKDLSDDSKLTPYERTVVSKEWDEIQTEYMSNKGTAEKYNVDTTTYSSAYESLKTYIQADPFTKPKGETIVIDAPTFNKNFNDYYSARVNLLNAVSAKANEVAQSAKNDIQKAVDAANSASDAANAASKKLDDWAADGVISPFEKQALKDEIARIDADKTDINNNYTKYSLGTPAAYNTAHKNYRNDLVRLTKNMTESTSIGSLATYQKTYYEQRTAAYVNIAKAVTDYTDSSFKVLDDSINSKVEKSTYDELEKKVTNQQTTIDQTAKDITAQAKEINTLSTGVKENKDAIAKISPDSITLEVTNNIKGDLDKINQQVDKNTQSLLELTPDGISLQVKQEVDKISIGGRNLALNSQIGDVVPLSNYTYSYVDDSSYGRVLQIQRTGGTPQNFQTRFNTADIPLGVEITLSVKAKMITSNGNFLLGFGKFGSGAQYSIVSKNSKSKDLGNGWKLYYNSITTPTSGSFSLFGINSCDGTVQVCQVKIEEGNVPTAWTAAPEDLEGKVEKNSEALLKLTPEQISIKIKEESQLGENLLSNSKLDNPLGWRLNGKPEFVEFCGRKCMKCTAGGNGVYLYNDLVSNMLGTYTLSVDVYVESDLAVTELWLGITDIEPYKIGLLKSKYNKWIRISQTITLKDHPKSSIICYLISPNVTAYFKNIKLEKGSTASPWSPSSGEELKGANLLPSDSSAWENGSVSESKPVGTSWEEIGIDSANRIRTKNLVYIGNITNDGLCVKAYTEHEVFITEFDKDEKYLGINSSVRWSGGTLISLNPNCRYIGVVLRRKNDATITASEMDIAKVKIEAGSTPTAYTPYQNQAIKKDLLATGIDIDAHNVTLTAKKTWIQDNNGIPIALFSSNTEEGIQFNSNVYCNYIRATKGTIAGFTIASDKISYTKGDDAVSLGTTGLYIKNKNGSIQLGVDGARLSNDATLSFNDKSRVNGFKFGITNTKNNPISNIEVSKENVLIIDAKPFGYIEDNVKISLNNKEQRGFVLFVRRAPTFRLRYTLTASHPFVKKNGEKTNIGIYEINDNMSRIFIFDGEYWNEF